MNNYVTKESTKLEDLKVYPTVIEDGDFCTVDDLDSGYWHVPLARESWPYCGCLIANPEDGKVHHYQWVFLFLGLTSAVTIFTNVLNR